MTAAERRAASVRLLLPHPDNWTVNEAREAETCSGCCTVRYEAGLRVVDVPQPCPAHSADVDVDVEGVLPDA